MKLPPAEPPDRERFLAAVAQHVPLDRVVELYLFQPIRQGGVESGVAVIAAAGDAAAPTTEPTEGEPATGEPDVGAGAEATATDAATTDETVSHAPVTDAAADSDDALPAAEAPPVGDDADRERPEARYTVFTARYRHVLKGPERGRWEVSVVAEADAPLATVSAVVRGVQRRAGDAEPPEYMSGDALRDALGRQSAPQR